MSFDAKIANEICERIANGESVLKILGRNASQRPEGYPSQFLFYSWLLDAEEEGATEEMKSFSKKYTRAREIQAEILVDEIIEISDNASDDIQFKPSNDSDGEGAEPFIKHSTIARARLQTDNRKWYAGKVKPKKYGEKISAELTGKDGGAIETRNISKEEIDKRLQELLVKTMTAGSTEDDSTTSEPD